MTAEIDIENFSRFCGPIPDALLLVSALGIVQAFNLAAKALGGLLGVELQDCQLSDLVLDPSDKVERYLGLCARSREMVPEVLAFRTATGAGQSYRIDGAVVRPRIDATPALCLLQCRPQLDSASALTALTDKLAALSLELAGCRHTEAALQAQCESLHGTLSSIGEAVIAAHSSGEVTFVNPVAAHLTGWVQGEALGRPLQEVYRTIADQSQKPSESPAAPAAPAVPPHGQPYNKSAGGPSQMGIVQGGTCPSPLAEQSSSSLPPPRGAFRCSPSLLPADDYRRACCPPAIAGVSRAAATEPAGPERLRQMILISRQGVAWPIEDSASPIRDAKGNVTGVVVVFRQISQRQKEDRQREELLAREKALRIQAQKTNRMKDEFLANLSHELRTPLSAITGWVLLIKQRELDPEQIDHGLEVIERNVWVQTQLINDLLDVSRILSGKLTVDFKPVNLISVIAAALDSVQVAATTKGISLRTQLDGDASLVQGDPVRLQQVVWNLLQNSIKFTPSGGRIELRLEREDTAVKFTVTDNGIGIAPELLPQLFERFQKVESPSTRRPSGLGLGLALVRELTGLQGGTVTAESPGVGKGTSVTVRLPPRNAPMSANDFPQIQQHTAEMPVARANPLGGLCVLLVEDDADSREIIRLALEGGGAKVIEASSVAQAKQLFVDRQPDVLVSDIGLPEEDGFSLIQYVRALPRAQGGLVPALALTAFACNVDSARALQEGFHRHLAKPAAPFDLVYAVAQIAGRA